MAHCDDVWELDKLEKQVEYLENHPDTGACFTNVQVIDDDGNALTPDSDGGYKVVWENCIKGDKNINIKALSSKKGNVIVTTWDPRRTGDDAISFTNTYIVKTEKYSVRAFTENYKVTVKMNH